jgi:quercetin dioxygenase-like cupin family protein
MSQNLVMPVEIMSVQSSLGGRADQNLKPGDWFEVPAEVPHSVTCQKPGRALGHYVVEKDKPLVSWL